MVSGNGQSTYFIHPPTSLVDGWFYLRDWSFYSSDISYVST